MCNCIEILEEKVAEKYNATDVSMKCSYSFNDFLRMPSGMEVRYRGKEADGTPKATISSVPVYPTFCPFCGKPYKEEQPSEEQPS